MRRLLAGVCLFFLLGVNSEVFAFSEADLDKLQATESCTDCDLSKANLVRAVLLGSNLRDTNFSGANLRSADLTGANLIGANLKGSNLTTADFTDAKLIGANLTDANLTKTDLIRANLTGANLTRANLDGTHLSEARYCFTLMPDESVNNSGCGTQELIKNPQGESLHALCADAKEGERECFNRYLREWGILED